MATKRVGKRTKLTPRATISDYDEVLSGVVELLEQARRTAARSVNAIMTATYWEIGQRIVEFEQGGEERAGYGEQLLEQLAEDLTKRFGRGFSRQNLQQMRQFYSAWPSDRIRQTVSGGSQRGARTEIPQAVSAESERAAPLVCRCAIRNLRIYADCV